MVEDQIRLSYSQYVRYIVVSAVPVNKSLILELIDSMKTEYFGERRELGIINVGESGAISFVVRWLKYSNLFQYISVHFNFA